MTRPVVDEKILAAGLMPKGHPGGWVIVKCVLTAEGEIRSCVTQNDEAGLAAATIQRLLSMRGTPATFKGQPVTIDYVFRIKFAPQ